MVSSPGPLHPGDDLLADLVADALPTADARAVEAHVLECARCSGLLADAEHVRTLLVRHDPGPMPAEVVARLESALQLEATTLPAEPDLPRPAASPPPSRVQAPPPGQPFPGRPPASPFPVNPSAEPFPPSPDPAVEPAPQPLRRPTAWSDTTMIEAFESVMNRRDHPDAEPPAPAGSPADGWDDDQAPARRPPRAPRLSRPSRSISRSRRDVRQEVREVKAGRRGTLVLAVAGVVAVLGLAGFAIRGFVTSTGGTVAAQDAAGDTALKGPTGPPVVTTGTDYLDAKLEAQIRALVADVSAGGSAGGSAAPPSAASPQVGAEKAAASPVPSPAHGNQALRDQQTLQGCLSALQARNEQPVAVDLATYDGRDAAIIVLLSNNGYEVWVVARTCRAGNDDTLKYLSLPS